MEKCYTSIAEEVDLRFSPIPVSISRPRRRNRRGTESTRMTSDESLMRTGDAPRWRFCTSARVPTHTVLVVLDCMYQGLQNMHITQIRCPPQPMSLTHVRQQKLAQIRPRCGFGYPASVAGATRRHCSGGSKGPFFSMCQGVDAVPVMAEKPRGETRLVGGKILLRYLDECDAAKS